MQRVRVSQRPRCRTKESTLLGDEAPFRSSTSCSDGDDEDLRSLAPELRQRRGRGGEGVALREVGGEKSLRWEIWAAASWERRRPRAASRSRKTGGDAGGSSRIV